ncbi:E3 ubiquitin-protein ligase AMFR-like isoform X2 [Babylonia areolata]|uniref:E3 ubiquitin-protein ligase AMFR-like isoform X2 n=1 Tax=Babylonia areolata TaxID=304850 RepID=UPI003FD39FA2
MPAVLLERVPLPSLQTYVTLSVVFLASALLYTHHTVITAQSADNIQDQGVTPRDVQEEVPPILSNTLESDIEPKPEILEENALDPETLDLMAEMESGNLTLPYESYEMNFLWVLTSEAWCVWTMVNSVYCVLILLGKLIQAVVFGDLRVSEQQHLKDKFWNFVFYKFIFIFGVMNVQTMEEVVLWVAWFTCLGFLHLLVQLSKDRFEYLSFSPAIPRSSHVKLLSLLVLLMACSGVLLCVCVAAGFRFGITIFAFMAAECVLLGLKTLYVVVRYMIHLWDLSLESVWENRSVYVYYSELVFELSSLSIDFAHHLHMLLWGNIFLSMASLVICMQLRYLFYEFQRRIKRHKNYRRVVRNMQARFPMATQEDLELNADECAICWEGMEAARKLPCGHLFHNSCLRSWLEQDTSCPTCRMSLSERPATPNANAAPTNAAPGNAANMTEGAPAGNQGTTNHFFHFDASRYISWLPSFSVEVTHTSLLPGQQLHLQTSQLDSMLRQVQTMFPNFPQQVILDDLRQTRSVEVTIDNILENRLQPEAMALPSTVSRTAEMALQAALASPSRGSGEPVQPSSDADALASGTQASQLSLSEQTSSDLQSSMNSEGAVGGDSQIQAQGGRFSKSASERMTMLQERKKAMLEQARRRYLSRHSEAADSSSSTPRSDDELTRRRELMFQATQRRLNNA